MSELNAPVIAIKPRTSKLAVAAFVLGMLSIPSLFLVAEMSMDFYVFWPILVLPATIFGVIALLKTIGPTGVLKGKGYAIASIVIPLVTLVLLAFLLPAIHVAKRIICCTNIEGLVCALRVYANDYNEQLPPADHWCDLLITECDVAPKSLICPGSDAIEGESTYAININVIGKTLNQLPEDMVLLFETDAGWDYATRSDSVNRRKFYSFIEKEDSEQSKEWIRKNKDRTIYPNRWNLAGGPEMLTTRYHNGEGCNVFFVDGHASYIPSNQIHTLRWTADKP